MFLLHGQYFSSIEELVVYIQAYNQTQYYCEGSDNEL